jgi:hypothetical protein
MKTDAVRLEGSIKKRPSLILDYDVCILEFGSPCTEPNEFDTPTSESKSMICRVGFLFCFTN